MFRSWATGRSIRTARSSTGPTATFTAGFIAPLSSLVRRSRSSVMRSKRAASSPISATNSRVVSGSMFSVCRMESVSSLMPARGVFISWEASDTKRRRASSVVWSRPVRLLNSAAIWAISSEPFITARWLYEPSRTLAMACKSWLIRRVNIRDSSTLMPITATATTAEMVIIFFCRSFSSVPCCASY